MAICKFCGCEINQNEIGLWAGSDQLVFPQYCNKRYSMEYHEPKQQTPYAIYMLEQMDPEEIGPMDWISVYAARSINYFTKEDGWADDQFSHDLCLLTITCENEPKIEEWIDNVGSYCQFREADRKIYM